MKTFPNDPLNGLVLAAAVEAFRGTAGTAGMAWVGGRTGQVEVEEALEAHRVLQTSPSAVEQQYDRIYRVRLRPVLL